MAARFSRNRRTTWFGRTWPITGAAPIVAVIALSACGGSSSGAAGGASTSESTANTQSAAGAPTDACKLITKDEANAAFGDTFDDPKSEVKNTVGRCTYTHGSNDLEIAVTPRLTKPGFDKLKSIYGPSATDVPGIGDGAFEVGRIISVIKGSTLVTIGTGDGPAIISDDKLLGLVRTAVSRI